MAKRFIVIGLGNFGSGVAETLHTLNNEVVALDVHEDAVDRIAAHVTRAAVGDGRDAQVLERIGARDADGGIISTGDDITASVLSTLALRDVGVKEIYVKVISHEHARVMEKLGVTETVFPERDSARRLGHRISSRTLLNYIELGTDFGMQEMAVPDAWVGKTLRQLQLPRKFGVSVIAVHDVLTDEMKPVPDPDAVLKESDTLLVAGTTKNLARCAKLG
jgi:trk system potassium uptake protein TrkA